MRTYKLPFHVREKAARRRKERYASDPDYRLRIVNANRKFCGLPLVQSPDEVPTISDASKVKAARRPRNQRGMFA